MTRLKDLLDYLDYLDSCSDNQFLKFCDAMEKRGYQFVTQYVLDYDYPHVTHCKDCKHWLPHEQFGFDYDNGEYHNYCALLVPEDDDYYAFTREADEFCSRAERKDNGADKRRR